MTRIPCLHAASGWAVAALLSAAAGLISPANAQTIGSSYTSTASRDCRMIGKPSELDGSTTRLCPTKAGLVVRIAEDDLRETVSVGRNRAAATKELAAQVWFCPFNSTSHTVEWRGRGRQAVRDHSALAHRRQWRPGERAADRQTAD
jgi:hypothetical protein